MGRHWKTGIAIITLLIAARAGEGNASGTTSAEFLRLNPDPVSVALGDGILSIPGSAAGMMANPAGSASIFRSNVSFTDSSFPEGMKYRFIGFVTPFKRSSIGASFSYIGYGDIKGLTTDGTPYPIASPEDVSILLNYSIKVGRSVPVRKEYGSIGVNLKIIRSVLGEYTADATAVDIGGICSVPLVRGLSAGVVYSNLGTAIKYANKPYELPSTLHFGLRYDILEWKNAFFAADFGNSADRTSFSLGASVSPLYPVTLRAGWKETDKALDSGLRVGVGMDFNDFSLSYAMSPFKNFSSIHQIGIEIGFGRFVQPRVAYNHYLMHYFEQVRNKYKKRDYIGARQLLEEILSVYPDHEESKEYLQRISQDLDEVEQERQREINRWIRRGNVALSRNNIFKARKYYNSALKLDPENEYAREGQETIDAMLEELKNDKALRSNKERIVGLWESAMGYYARGEFVYAKEKFQELIQIDPENAEAMKYLNEIENQLEKVNAIQINDLYMKGLDLFRAGNYREAVKYFSAVVIASPHRVDAQEYYTECQRRVKEEEDNQKAAEQSFKQGKIKSEVENTFNTALRLFENGDYEEAIKAFAKSRDIASRYEYDRYVESSKSYMNSARNALAEKHFKAGFDYFQKNRLEPAAYAYRKAMEYNPDYASAKVELDRISETLSQQFYEQGMKAFSNGEKDKARELFKKSLTFKPDKLEAQRALDRIR